MKPLVPLTRGQVGLLGWGRDDRNCTFSDVGGSLPPREEQATAQRRVVCRQLT